MATSRVYTNISQSKVLAEILPLESADMSYVSNGLGKPFARTIPIKGHPEEVCACWSLAALLGYLSANFYVDIKYLDGQWKLDCRVQVAYSKELIDACTK